MIDLNDYKHFETTRHGKRVSQKLYRYTCNNCGLQGGYRAKSYKAKFCVKCVKIGTSVSAETKLKMSIAAKKRYNDPDWQPHPVREKFTGCRRPKNSYKTLTTPLQRKLRHRTKSLLWQKLLKHSANKMGSTFDVLGYTVDDLIEHLESQFTEGMSWDNYGTNGWEIDHKVPDSWFVYSSVEDQGFKDSWALSNLQPMWASNNRSKGARYCETLNEVNKLCQQP